MLANRRYRCDVTQSLKAESPAGDSGRASIDHWGHERSHEMWGLLLNRRYGNFLEGHELSVTGRAQPLIGCCKGSWESRPGVP